MKTCLSLRFVSLGNVSLIWMCNLNEEVKKVSAAVDAFMGFLPLAILPFSEQIQRLPLPAMKRIRKGQADLDAIIYAMIDERRKSPGDRGDLLSMLLEAVDPEGSTAEHVEPAGTR